MGKTKIAGFYAKNIQNPADPGEKNRTVSMQNQWYGRCSGRTTYAWVEGKEKKYDYIDQLISRLTEFRSALGQE